ncbi:hypothetical protein Tco_0539809 [Tanacetum coccineum]
MITAKLWPMLLRLTSTSALRTQSPMTSWNGVEPSGGGGVDSITLRDSCVPTLQDSVLATFKLEGEAHELGGKHIYVVAAAPNIEYIDMRAEIRISYMIEIGNDSDMDKEPTGGNKGRYDHGSHEYRASGPGVLSIGVGQGNYNQRQHKSQSTQDFNEGHALVFAGQRRSTETLPPPPLCTTCGKPYLGVCYKATGGCILLSSVYSNISVILEMRSPPTGEAEAEMLKEQIQEMFGECLLLEPSGFRIGVPPVLFVKKKDGTTPSVLKVREHNQITIRIAILFPQNLQEVVLMRSFRSASTRLQQVAFPLRHILYEKGEKFVWTDDVRRVFEEIETEVLVIAPILTLPSGSGVFQIYSDANRRKVCGMSKLNIKGLGLLHSNSPLEIFLSAETGMRFPRISLLVLPTNQKRHDAIGWRSDRSANQVPAYFLPIPEELRIKSEHIYVSFLESITESLGNSLTDSVQKDISTLKPMVIREDQSDIGKDLCTGCAYEITNEQSGMLLRKSRNEALDRDRRFNADKHDVTIEFQVGDRVISLEGFRHS